MIDKITKSYWDNVHSSSDQSNPGSDKTLFTNFYTLKNSQSKLKKSCQKSVNSSAMMLILHLVLSKLITILKYFLVYKFVCARCNSCYIVKTCRHFKTRINEHVKKDKKSNIYKHLHNNEEFFSSFNLDCLSILDYAPNTVLN